ncbi:MAG: LysR family transcriptional regulator [Roseovarius sp.]|nr:LysR family transcriptional regulator [Roseovarius sp.]
MSRVTHLNALQALDMALREGSLQGAGDRLGITPAAVGQRIRALEAYLETDLLLRGRSGLRPTPALQAALDDLHAAFAALDRVADSLDFQRSAEIHITADPGWAEWLAAHPHGRTAPERGVNYALVRNALDSVKSDAGLLVCGLSCVLDALEAGSLSLSGPRQPDRATPLPPACPPRGRLARAGHALRRLARGRGGANEGSDGQADGAIGGPRRSRGTAWPLPAALSTRGGIG